MPESEQHRFPALERVCEPHADLIARGVDLHMKGAFSQAEDIYAKILSHDAKHVLALHLLGVVMIQTGRLESGVGLIDAALALKPDFAEAFSNRGNALQDLKRLDEALASFDKAVALKPGFAEAHYNRGNVLMELRRLDEALASFDRALALRPGFAEALANRGNALLGLERPDEALASFDRALAIKPHHAEALTNRGNALKELKRSDEALASFDKALALNPDYAEAHYNRGNALQDLRRLDEALAAFDKALALKPDVAEASFNRALLFLLRGDLAAGWPGYEGRWDQKHAASPKMGERFPIWRGENLSGKKIIVFDEQGLGDVIQFSRYLSLFARIGAQATFLARPALVRLMQPFASTVRVVSDYPAGEAFDRQSALLSLPLAFGTTLETIPASTPYLRAEPERVRKWRERLGEQGFKVGIAWQAGRTGKIDIGRSFALAEFSGLSRIPGVRLISLQKSQGVEQLRQAPAGVTVETLGEDYDSGPDAFLDAAAAMENLDLVISSDTSIAHLAGALGRPVWVALKHDPDWRWMLDRPDSPWYPTMRLFRQKSSGDWRSVFADIESALRQLIGPEPRQAGKGGADTPNAPISGGELIDRITILEIKSVEIANEPARANVFKELRLLQEIADAHAGCGAVSPLKSRLKEVNRALWQIEDAIREKERKGEFDQDFIELARSVYKRNDERAAIKRQINDFLASEIVEEKSYQNY
jgi:tetratricopeptide (TPR) repeat protein